MLSISSIISFVSLGYDFIKTKSSTYLPYILAAACVFFYVKSTISSLEHEKAEAENKIYKESALSSAEALDVLKQYNVKIGEIVGDIGKIKEDLRLDREKNVKALNELVKSNSHVKEWADESIPKEVQSLIYMQ